MLEISESQQKKFGLSFGPVSNSFSNVSSTVSNSVGSMNSALLSPRGKDKDKEKDKDSFLKDDIEISGIFLFHLSYFFFFLFLVVCSFSLVFTEKSFFLKNLIVTCNIYIIFS
jgi:hypothetical protein